MKLVFTGKGSAFTPELGNTSGFFIKDDDLFVLDMGETVFEKLSRKLELSSFKDIHILITHLHSDHVGSLGTVISYMYCIYGKKIDIYHPEENLRSLLSLMGIDEKMYDFHKDKDTEIEGIKISFVATPHVEDMACYGIIIGDRDESIYYSGDSKDIPNRVLDEFFEGKIRIIYQDTTMKNSPEPTHMSLALLEEKIPPEYRHRVYCMHLEEGAVKKIEDKGFKCIK